MSTIHLNLIESFNYLTQNVPTKRFSQDTDSNPSKNIPRNIKEALSDKFIAEWGPAIDKENQGVIKHR